MSAVTTRDLAVGYDKKTVVEGIRLEVIKGHVVCLLGPNGSGKSTILKTLSALLSPVKGAIYLHGEKLPEIKRRALAKMLAVVLTERFNAGYLSAFDVAAMGRYPHTGFLGGLKEKDREEVWSCLRMVHAEDIAMRIYNELSDGEKQKILLARALAQEPELIILDEPTTHLDVRHKLEVMAILKKLSREKGITVILSLHEIDLALKSCDIAVLVKDGKIVGAGAPEEVGNNSAVCGLYDMGGAGYNAFIGAVELLNTGRPEVFVAGGGGSAAGLYRLLTKNGVGFDTGILHENDIDCHIVETMGIRPVKEKAFEPIGGNAANKARALVEKASLVVDAGFPATDLNRANIKLVTEAVEGGKKVCTLRSETESRRLYGEWGRRIISCATLQEVLEYCGGEPLAANVGE